MGRIKFFTTRGHYSGNDRAIHFSEKEANFVREYRAERFFMRREGDLYDRGFHVDLDGTQVRVRAMKVWGKEEADIEVVEEEYRREGIEFERVGGEVIVSF